MKKRSIALLLSVVMLVGLLAGCGSSSSSEEDSETSAASESAEVAEEAEEPEEEAEEAESAEEPEAEELEEAEPEAEGEEPEAASQISYPLVESTETLSAFGALSNLYTGLDINDFAIYQAAEEATGVHIDWTTVDQDASSDNFALLIAGGDWPDFAVGGIRYYTSGSEAAVEDEVFVDLAPYIEDYAPDYYSFLQSDSYYMKLVVTANGYIPSVGRIGYGNSSGSGIMIRQDWLDDLGLDRPSTYSQLTEVLEAFKAAYDCDWAIMKGSALYFDIAGTMLGGYGVTSDFTVRDGVVYYSPTLPEWKDYMSMIAQWYEEGLFSPDYVNIVGTSFTSQLYSGEVGCWVGAYDFLSESTSSMVADENFYAVAIPDMTVEEGDTIHTGSLRESITPTSSWSIFTTSENLELALEYCNWFFTEEGSVLTNVGEEGVAWEYDADGEIVYTDLIMHNPDGYTVEVAKGLYGGGFLNPGYGSWDNVSAGFGSEEEKNCFDVWNSNKDDLNRYSTLMTADESSEYSALNSDLSTYLDESFNKVIVGTMSLDEWDDVVQNMYDNFGLQDMLDICQTAYDRYMNS